MFRLTWIRPALAGLRRVRRRPAQNSNLPVLGRTPEAGESRRSLWRQLCESDHRRHRRVEQYDLWRHQSPGFNRQTEQLSAANASDRKGQTYASLTSRRRTELTGTILYA